MLLLQQRDAICEASLARGSHSLTSEMLCACGLPYGIAVFNVSVDITVTSGCLVCGSVCMLKCIKVHTITVNLWPLQYSPRSTQICIVDAQIRARKCETARIETELAQQRRADSAAYPPNSLRTTPLSSTVPGAPRAPPPGGSKFGAFMLGSAIGYGAGGSCTGGGGGSCGGGSGCGGG